MTLHEHSFSTVIFYVDGVEMGHLHGDAVADLEFPAKMSKKLLADGRVLPHHIIPESGWVSHEIKNAKDVEDVIALFSHQYERLAKSK